MDLKTQRRGRLSQPSPSSRLHPRRPFDALWIRSRSDQHQARHRCISRRSTRDLVRDLQIPASPQSCPGSRREIRNLDERSGDLLHAEDLLEGLADLVTRVNVSQGVLPQPVPQAQRDDAVNVLGGDLGKKKRKEGVSRVLHNQQNTSAIVQRVLRNQRKTPQTQDKSELSCDLCATCPAFASGQHTACTTPIRRTK